MLYGASTNTGPVITQLEYQVEHVIRQLARMDAQGLKCMDVHADLMQHYNEQLQRDLDAVDVWQVECHNYYRAGAGRIVTHWPHTMAEYGRRTRLLDPDAYAVG